MTYKNKKKFTWIFALVCAFLCGSTVSQMFSERQSVIAERLVGDLSLGANVSLTEYCRNYEMELNSKIRELSERKDKENKGISFSGIATVFPTNSQHGVAMHVFLECNTSWKESLMFFPEIFVPKRNIVLWELYEEVLDFLRKESVFENIRIGFEEECFLQ